MHESQPPERTADKMGFPTENNQKRPDVHKNVLSIKLRFPPPEKVSILSIFC